MVYLIALGVSGKHLVSSSPALPSTATAPQLLTFGASIAGFVISYCPLSSDFTSYMLEDTPGIKVFMSTFLGLYLPTVSKLTIAGTGDPFPKFGFSNLLPLHSSTGPHPDSWRCFCSGVSCKRPVVDSLQFWGTSRSAAHYLGARRREVLSIPAGATSLFRHSQCSTHSVFVQSFGTDDSTVYVYRANSSIRVLDDRLVRPARILQIGSFASILPIIARFSCQSRSSVPRTSTMRSQTS